MTRLIKHIFSILLFFGLIFTLSTCKKYPEGGFLKQGPKIFITTKKGAWKLNLYEVNGIDSTFLIKTPIVTTGPSFYEETIKCDYIDKKDNKNELFTFCFNYNYLTNFINKNAQITFKALGEAHSQCQNNSSGVLSCQRNILNPEGIGLVNFTIIKLKDNECILTTKLKNNYKIILVR